LYDSLEQLAPALDQAELDERLAVTMRRSHALRVRRTRRRFAAGGVSAVLVLALVAVGIRTGRPAQPVTGATTWQLVSYVDPSWQQLPSAGYAEGVGLECPTNNDCYAIDTTAEQVEVTNDGGTTWHHVSLPGDVTTLSSPACAGPSTCSLIGTDASGSLVLLTTIDGGATWTTHPTGQRPIDGAAIHSHGSPAPYRYVPALTCATATSCVSVITVLDASSAPSSVAIATHDGGTSWSTSVLPSDFDLLGASCGSGSCVLVGANASSSPLAVAYVSTNGGDDWSPATLPVGTGALTSVSCAPSSTCYAVASSNVPGGAATSGVLMSTDGGTSWQETDTSALPDSILTAISCAGPATCWASGVRVPVGGDQAITVAEYPGVLATTSDGGASWQAAPLPDAIRAVAQVSCPSTTTCFALAYHMTSAEHGSFVLLARHA
jgi:hypothetical protein